MPFWLLGLGRGAVRLLRGLERPGDPHFYAVTIEAVEVDIRIVSQIAIARARRKTEDAEITFRDGKPALIGQLIALQSEEERDIIEAAVNSGAISTVTP